LYVRAVFQGFRRGKENQTMNQVLAKVEGLKDRQDVPYYLGKRVVYVYKAKKGFKVI
jgi:large subunit ribosomal protein L35Ae